MNTMRFCGPVIPILLIILSSCGKDSAQVLVIDHEICKQCSTVVDVDSQIVELPLERIKRDPRRYTPCDTTMGLAWQFERNYKSCYQICSNCIKQNRQREEEEASKKQARFRKKIGTSCRMEMTNLTPVDYVIRYSLKNKTGKKQRVTYSVRCSNFSTPSAFFAMQSFRSELEPYETGRYQWRPEEEIYELRLAIAAGGANLKSIHIEALKDTEFECEIELDDVSTF